MTEAEWLTSTDPEAMLATCRDDSNRKLRLFAVACCRHIWDSTADERAHKAVAMAERYADGRASEEELRNAKLAALRALEDAFAKLAAETPFLWAAAYVARTQTLHAARWVSYFSAEVRHFSAKRTEDEHLNERGVTACVEYPLQADFLRDIFGNPFRPVSLDCSWVVWNGGTISKLAQRICDERSFDLLPVLGDALQDAGCCNPDVLGHCYGPGPHVRGCWVVDLLLGKE